jgi:uncharacterized protein involved in outer membrane biogenesis
VNGPAFSVHPPFLSTGGNELQADPGADRVPDRLTGNGEMKRKFLLKRYLLYLLLAIILLAAGGYVFLRSYDFSRFSSRITGPVEEVLDRKVTIGGAVRLALGMRPRVLLEDVALKNAPWGLRGEMARVERIEFRTRLLPLFLGRVEVTEVILVKPDILLEKSESGRFNISGSRLKGLAAIPDTGFETVEIREGTLAYRDHNSDKTHRFFLERVRTARQGPDDRIQLDVEARYAGKTVLLGGTVGSLWRIGVPEMEWPLDLRAEYRGASMRISGGIKDLSVFRGLLLDFTANGKGIEHLFRLAGYRLPFGGQFCISGRLADPANRVYKISELQVDLAGSQLAGSAEVDVSEDRPCLSLDLRSQKLDLRPFFDSLVPKGPVHTREGCVLPDIAIPLAWLDKVNLKMDLTAQEVLTPGPTFLHLRAKGSLRDGALAVKPVTAHIGKGTVKAELEIRPTASEPLIDVSLDMEAAAISDLLGQGKGGRAPEGTISVDIAAAGRGVTTGSVMAGLSGKVRVTLQKGLIRRKWVEGIGRGTKVDIAGFLEPKEGDSSHVRVNCIVCAFEIQRGVAKSSALFLDTPGMVVAGKGQIDLRTEQIDFSLNQVSKEGIGFGVGGVGSIGLNVSNLTEPLKISGTLADPSLTVDPGDAVLTIAKIAGGIVLFGPLGIVAALIDSDLNDINSCEAAIEASERGVEIRVEEDKDMFFFDVTPGYDP